MLGWRAMGDDRDPDAAALHRWYRPTMTGLTVVILLAAAVVTWLSWSQLTQLGRVGADLTLYLDATRRWLAGGSFYPEHQLAGPYLITDGDILYPPSTIPFFVAFLVLPSILFWVIPITILVWVIGRYRPAPWTWPVMAACLAYIPTMVKVLHGNPFMWASAAVALGTVYGWPALLVMLKPSLAPFGLIGIRRRSWWVAAGGLGAAVAVTVVVFLPLWRDYVTVLTDSHNAEGIFYSLSDVPLVLIPVIAYLGRTRQPATASVPAEQTT
jgi:hypothetical protein